MKTYFDQHCHHKFENWTQKMEKISGAGSASEERHFGT